MLSPPAVLPFANVCRPVNRVNQRLLASLIRQAAPGPYVLLATLPGSVDLVPALAPVATVYDCVDFHSEFPGFVSPPVVDRMEADLAGVSRVVFTTARRLQERMEQLHTDVRLIPNAAETEHFQAALSAEPHEELGAIPRPRVAMVGGVGPWIDQRWLAELADRLPGVQFVLIGPVETDVTALRQRANVHLLGRRPYNRLPRYLAGCQAALVPFRTDDPVAMAVNPIKVYEYLAAGREVVATPIPELLQMDDLLWLAPDAETAAEALRRILDGERRAPDERIQTFVAANSWDARVQAVDEALRSVVPLALRPAGPA
ncbi:MAG: glycosyltransferase [Alicyclobacillaceae bacterium]|nr:glycosyltransferase [Alicyclobacillaceae bacterium]